MAAQAADSAASFTAAEKQAQKQSAASFTSAAKQATLQKRNYRSAGPRHSRSSSSLFRLSLLASFLIPPFAAPNFTPMWKPATSKTPSAPLACLSLAFLKKHFLPSEVS